MSLILIVALQHINWVKLNRCFSEPLSRGVLLFSKPVYNGYMIIIYICIFFLGASIASYINATLYRIEKNTKLSTLLSENSHCEKCKKKLTWYELIPVIGFFIIGGKCPKCGMKVNIYYPLSEAFFGISFLLLYYNQAPVYIWIVLLLLFILSYYDFLYREIPRTLVHILIAASILIFVFFNLNLLSALLTVGILSVIFLLTLVLKKSFGFGDILVLLSLGLISSAKQFLVIFWISVFSALLYAVLFGRIKKEPLKGVKIPMVPFFALAFLFGSIWGNQIFEFFLKTFY